LKKKRSASLLIHRWTNACAGLAILRRRNQDGRATPMNERYIRWYTPWPSREFGMLAFGKGGGLPLIIFPTSFGNYYQNKDFGLVGSVSEFVDAGRVTVYCPDAHRSGKFLQQINPPSR
jgi:hypothetical protein